MARTRSLLVIGLVALGLIAGCKNKEKSGSEMKTAQKSLYDRLGGEGAIRAVVDDFVPRAAANPKVNFSRKGVPGFTEWQATPENVSKLKTGLVMFIAEATGGPQKYTGLNMRDAHKGMKITNAEFDAIAADLQASLTKLNVPAKESSELMAIVATTRKDMVGQ